MSDNKTSIIQKIPQLYSLNNVGTQNLETERLMLRKFKVEDAFDMYNNWANNPQVAKHLNWLPHRTIDETRELLSTWVLEYEKKHYYNWCIVLKKTNQAVGSIGVVKIFEQTCCCEIGYALSQQLWNRGIMTEAFNAVKDFLFERANFNRIQSYFNVKNIASGKVMEKVGLKYEGTLRQYNITNTGELCDCHMYAILKEDYLKNKT